MSATLTHYDNILGPVYAWMVGGTDRALEHGHSELMELGIKTSGGTLAVDLGAGFGMHTLPLARLGFRVLAIDSCKSLIDTIRERTESAAIDPVHDDLLSFRHHLRERPELVLCMGDTLTHLADYHQVVKLVESVADILAHGGRFVVTFRDYTNEATGVDRFISVRSDATRIHTCFLEYNESHVQVHDLLHEKEGAEWTLRIGSYPKLRIAPAWFVELLRINGLSVVSGAGPSGMIRFIARREPPGPDQTLINS